MKAAPQRTTLLLAIAGLSLGAVAVALWTQYALGMEPCPWCVLQRLVFVAIALLVALRMLFNRESWRVGDTLPTGIGNQVAGVVIGTLSGLMGIGGGVLNNTYMTSFGRPIHQAVATSSGVGVLISIPGILGYIWAGWGLPGLPPGSTGFINWIATALIVPIALVVTPWGVRLAHSMSKRQLEVGFGIFLILVSLRFLASIYG